LAWPEDLCIFPVMVDCPIAKYKREYAERNIFQKFFFWPGHRDMSPDFIKIIDLYFLIFKFAIHCFALSQISGLLSGANHRTSPKSGFSFLKVNTPSRIIPAVTDQKKMFISGKLKNHCSSIKVYLYPSVI